MENQPEKSIQQKGKPNDSPVEKSEPDQGGVEDSDATGTTVRIPVIGLGGSAGALDPFKKFFSSMPADIGAAFVVIQHLSPTYKSLLSELLGQQTSMKVFEARDGMAVEPGCVYVIPPNKYLGIRNGVLFLTPPVVEHGIRMPIDFFFRLLADDLGGGAVGILFSGAGSDGTLGLRAIRGVAGLTVIQDESAAFTDMPRNALATGLVDLVLPPEKMGQAIVDYLRQPHFREEPPPGPQTEAKPDGFKELIAFLLTKTNCDFRCYKKSTILRRIERRMSLHHNQDIGLYLDLLRHDADEVVHLHRDLLINVTNFFRDPEAFEELRRQAVMPLIEDRQADEPIRIWVPGCSTGEEAYSLGMLFMEATVAARKPCPIQIFATDIDEEALQCGRIGLYPESIVADMGTERFEKYFVGKPHGVQVVEPLRKMIVFAAQNLVTDPPFSKMDVISCRNLMIYLNPETQEKLVALFNFALNPEGILFLGKSEGVAGRNDLFDTISKSARLYRRLTPPRPVNLDTPAVPGKRRASFVPAPEKPVSAFYFDAVRQVLLNHFAASVVLIKRSGQILQFHGQTGKYLNMPASEPVLNLLDIAKGGLTLSLRSALFRAVDEGKSVVMENVAVSREDGSLFVRLTVSPIPRKDDMEQMLAVLFEDVSRPAITGDSAPSANEAETIIRQLEDELRVTQQDLQSSVEELQSSNEEMLSSNEELQSTIEELETSKEELQSVNEELTTVNSQLQEKVERLDKANSDMANFLESTQIATLFLDGDLRIKLFTPAISRILNVIPSDIGRSVDDLSINFTDCDLKTIIRDVLHNGVTAEREARHANGNAYLLRVMPYRNSAGAPCGIVATFGDVTVLRRAEQQIRQLAVVVADSNDAVILAERDGRIRAWNRGAQRLYGWREDEALQMRLRDITPPNRDHENDTLRCRILSGETITSFETQRRAKDGHILDIWLTATLVLDESRTGEMIATTERDITERKKTERNLLEATHKLEQANQELEQITSIASHDLQEPLRMVGSFLTLLQDRCDSSLDEKSREYIRHAVGGAERMAQLIHDLLDYSHFQNEEGPHAPVDMNEVATKALDNCRDSIETSGASVTFDALPTVVGNKAQLVRLLQNLVSNSIKFHQPHGIPAIHVSARPEQDRWLFRVTDNGIGIPPEQCKRVFKMFERLHTQEEFPGSGIGLAICKKIVEHHGGKIWVKSELGQGTTVCFDLPAQTT